MMSNPQFRTQPEALLEVALESRSVLRFSQALLRMKANPTVEESYLLDRIDTILPRLETVR
jgi:hypothetical protein